MKTIADLIAEHPVFGDLDPAQRALIAGCGRNQVFHAGDWLMQEGDAADRFFALRRGKVTLFVHGPAQREIAIETLGPGDIVGLSWLFPPYRVQFDARAIGEVGALAFDGACLRAKCERDPALGYALMKRLAATMTQRLQAARLQLLDVYGP